MYGSHFYNESTRRYVAVFGTLFNNLQIERKSGSTSVQRMKVPINYAPMQKILARLEQDPDLDAPAMTLPRMSFEITGMSYSPERKLTSLTRQVSGVPTSDGRVTTMYTPAPYDIEFQLNIMTKHNEDGMKILEQILPYFKPDCTVSVKMIDELNTYVDIPILLTSVSQEDTYDGDFQTRRALIWTLNFTLKGYYFGPTSPKKQIKFADVNLYPNLPPLTGGGEQVHSYPVIRVGMVDDTENNSLTENAQYTILDLGTVDNINPYWVSNGVTDVQNAWKKYLYETPAGQADLKLNDTFTATSRHYPTSDAVVSLTYADIDIDDSWEGYAVIKDGDS